MKSVFFFAKDEHTAIVKEVIGGLKQLPVYKFTGKKVIFTGITGEPDEMLEILAENGIAVVGDDLVQEMRQYRTDIPEKSGGGLKRLALKRNSRHGCSLIHEVGKLRSRLCGENNVSGVVDRLMKFYDPEEYDQPYFESDLRAAGYPTLTIEVDSQNTSLSRSVPAFRLFAKCSKRDPFQII